MLLRSLTVKQLQGAILGLMVITPFSHAAAFPDDPGRVREFRYAIIKVPGLGSNFDQPHGINDLGHIVGDSVPANGERFHPFFWNGTKTIDLGTFGGDLGRAMDVNNKDWVVGGALLAGPGSDAFLWKNGGELIDLGNFGDANGLALGINEKNQIVGGAGTIPGIFHAFFWENGVIQDLGTLNGFGWSQALDINENGFITGWSNSPDNNQTFLWDPNTGEMARIGSLGEGIHNGVHRNEPQAMNNFNDIVGAAAVGDDRNGGPRPYIYHDGVMYNLQKYYTVDKGFEGGTSQDVNDAGQVVGLINRRNQPLTFGFIWENGMGMQIIDDMLPPNANWHVLEGAAINEHGQIAALASRKNRSNALRTLLLTPVEPELVLDAGDGPLVAGEVNVLRVTGAEVGAVVTFVYGKVGGGARIDGCSDLDAMLQIDGAKTIGTAVADENGVAVIKTLINPNAAGLKGRLLQAYDGDNCQESQLVQKRIE